MALPSMLGAVRPGLLVIVGALSLGPGAQPVRAASSAPHGVQEISEHAALEPGITSEPIQDSREQEHDHASHDEARETGSWKWVAWLGRLHPMIVHFPIALLTLAAFGARTRRATTRRASSVQPGSRLHALDLAL